MPRPKAGEEYAIRNDRKVRFHDYRVVRYHHSDGRTMFWILFRDPTLPGSTQDPIDDADRHARVCKLHNLQTREYEYHFLDFEWIPPTQIGARETNGVVYPIYDTDDMDDPYRLVNSIDEEFRGEMEFVTCELESHDLRAALTAVADFELPTDE